MEIARIISGVLVLIAIVATILFWLWQKKRSRRLGDRKTKDLIKGPLEYPDEQNAG